MYNYCELKPKIFLEENQKDFIKARDFVNETCKTAGAVSMGSVLSHVSGDSWLGMAFVDRLVELGEIKEVTQKEEVWGQHRIFVKRG